MTSKSCSLTRCLNNRRILIIYKKRGLPTDIFPPMRLILGPILDEHTHDLNKTVVAICRVSYS